MKNHISFPGLGIKEFTIDPVAFTIFGKDVMWYGVIISVGILLAISYVLYRAKHNEGIKHDDVYDYAIYVVLFGVIGARLYYVLTEFDQYKGKTFLETLKNSIAIWEGGLAIYGGIIAGGITLAIVSKIKKIKPGKAFDMVAPAVMLGQLIGRWGNFCNGEAYGWSENVATFPLRMHLRKTEISYGREDEIFSGFVHPTFLYESLWNLIGFILINLFYKKKKYDGQVFFMYITWYGFGRMLIEGLRTDSLYVGDFRISQVIGFLCFFFGLSILTAMEIVIRLRKKDEKLLKAAEAESAHTAEAHEEIQADESTKTTEEKDDSVFEIQDSYDTDE